ncbi:hypothetical protein B5F08_11790 [Anaeromassilibacillus sp. An172]|uniref:Shedu anti-phage system protein SduA domain-containing protein n=1 Tax=Anaeromassilibacillus sp. An172 TaxID=1965570 RepID=UPI000B3A2BB8|nr:Shedu anti-phage system protein SduA domain-containing protein [Anaeromassilibacillus sp. An172]OUP74848.1 hypothetical protein B5F08_11790 [Anaeromassilibacillus sp. An172]
MKPSKLYKKDFFELSSAEKKEKSDYIKSQETIDITKISLYSKLSMAVRHNLSLFPNNLVVLQDEKNTSDLEAINSKFYDLIHKEGALERDVLNYINHTPAYHIVCGILMDRFPFGHHECYLFKEFCLGSKYRADYMIIGKGSGGYEFVLVEFEKPEGRITLKDGHIGEAIRKGIFQVEDWKAWIEGNFNELSEDLMSVKGDETMPSELQKYDSTRFHYVVVCGLRSDFSDKTYRTAREKAKNLGIHLIHHDNLYKNAVELLKRDTF